MTEYLVPKDWIEQQRNEIEQLFLSGKSEEAIFRLLSLQSDYPEHSGLMNDLGAICTTDGDAALGRAYFERALYLNQNDTYARNNLAALGEACQVSTESEVDSTANTNGKKILFVAEYYMPALGGAELSVQAILSELVREGYQVTAVCQGSSFVEFKMKGVTIRHIPDVGHLREVADMSKQDLVLTQLNWAPEAFSLAKRENKPMVLFLRSYEHFCTVPLDMVKCVQERRIIGQTPEDEKRLAWHQEMLRAADKVICNSQFMNQVQRIFSNRDGEVVYPTIEFEKAVAPYHVPHFVAFGRPSVEKGLSIFVELAKKLPEHRLLSYGKNAFPLKQISPNIVDWGHGDIRIPFCKARVLLVPSIWLEPFGRIVLEAMANGIPVIASRIGGIPEAGGNAARYIDDIANIDSWLQAVQQILENPSLAGEMKEKGYARVNEFKQIDGLLRLKQIVSETIKQTSRSSEKSRASTEIREQNNGHQTVAVRVRQSGNACAEGRTSKLSGAFVYFQLEFPKHSETFIHAEMKEILRLHPETYVVTCRPNYHLLKDSPLRERIVEVPLGPSGQVDANAVAQTIARLNPSYLHVHWLTEAYGLIFPIAAVLKLPFGFTCHAADLWRRGNRIEFEAVGEMAKSPLCITAATEGTHHRKHLLWCGFSKEQIVLTPTAVDRTMLPSGRKTAPSSASDLVCVGRPVQKKGFMVAIDAVRFLRLQGFQCSLTILGGADSSSELGALLAQHVEQLPFVTATEMLLHAEVLERVSRADALVAPCMVAPDGDSDGLPTVLSEAMLMKIPVVTTDVASITDLVKPGETGFVARPGDPLSFAEKILELDHLLKDRGRAESFLSAAFFHAGQNDVANSAGALFAHVQGKLSSLAPPVRYGPLP